MRRLLDEPPDLDAEIFSPGYLFNLDGSAAKRPVINSLSASTAAVGSSLTVTTDSAVTRFSLIRYGSTTHTVNTDQRRTPLTAVSSNGNSYTVTISKRCGYCIAGVLDAVCGQFCWRAEHCKDCQGHPLNFESR